MDLTWEEGIDEVERLMLADAQTSGGLLIAVPAARLESLKQGRDARGVTTGAEIGEILKDGTAGTVEVVHG